jgi:sortase (surface protein transpeptidase)
LRATCARVGLVARVLVLACALAGCQSAVGSEQSPLAPPAEGIEADSFQPIRDYEQVALPVRLRIPALRVDTGLLRLGRVEDGTIAVPDSNELAGWYEEGPRPGQPGPAVILGHVDSKEGPAVFYALRRLPIGSDIHADRADGSTVTFRVTGRSQVPKTNFPSDLVYGATLEPSLRLVTCGGEFDRHAGSYLDNVIVYAEPA